MDQSSSFNSPTSNIPIANQRKYFSNALNTSQNHSYESDHFVTDNSLKWNLSFKNFKDWTMSYMRPRDKYEHRYRSFHRNESWWSKLLTVKNLTVWIALLSILLSGWTFLNYNYSINNHNQSATAIGNCPALEEWNIRHQELEIELQELKAELKATKNQRIESSIGPNEFDVRLRPYLQEVIERVGVVETRLDSDQTNPPFENKLNLIEERLMSNEVKQLMIESLLKSLEATMNKRVSNKIDLNESIAIEMKNSVRNEILNFFSEQNVKIEHRPDHSSELNGARVIDSSKTYIEPDAFTIFSLPLWSLSSAPSALLRRGPPLFDRFSKSWKMDSRKGFIRIRFFKPVVPVSFVYEHTIQTSLYIENKIDCAPRVFEVYGYQTEQSSSSIFLGRFEFEANKNTQNEFKFDHFEQLLSSIEFRIENNHGNQNYTCLYQIKVF